MRDFNLDGKVVGRLRPVAEGGHGIYEQYATQRFPIGTLYEKHGRKWRFCKAYEAITLPHRGSPNMAIIPGDTGGSAFGVEGNLYAEALAGAQIVYVATATAFPIDAFFGGLFVSFHGTGSEIACLRVSGNDLGNGTYVKVYLDEPLPWTVTVAYGINLHPSPYANCGNSSHVGTYASVVVVPMIAITSGYYFWGQTKGPAWVTPTVFGTAREKYFYSDGTLIDGAVGIDANQLAGYVLARTVTAGYGDGIIDLMLE